MQPAMRRNRVILDPADPAGSVERLGVLYDLPHTTLEILGRIITLYPRPVVLSVDESYSDLYSSLPLADKFTFDLENDELVLLSHDTETFIDATVEMAMYLAGFATLMGSSDDWVVEFAIGTWKPVKRRIKRQLSIPTDSQPRGVIGLPPPPGSIPAEGDVYPFRTLVTHFDQGSFYQMIVLAARDNISVYFPPETHEKVLTTYVYMRRAMHEVGQGLALHDYQEFNTRLLAAVQQIQRLFDPANLPAPRWTHQPDSDAEALGLFPPARPSQNPFEAFIEQLFPDDDELDSGDPDLPQ